MHNFFTLVDADAQTQGWRQNSDVRHVLDLHAGHGSIVAPLAANTQSRTRRHARVADRLLAQPYWRPSSLMTGRLTCLIAA
jgi:hypothetical protein